MKQLIYRIEDNDKRGFFRGHLIPRRKLKGLDKHPMPIEDDGINRPMEDGIEKCGFLDNKQLYNWVHINDIKMLESYGFTIKRIYREVTAIGECQVLYKEN